MFQRTYSKLFLNNIIITKKAFSEIICKTLSSVN